MRPLVVTLLLAASLQVSARPQKALATELIEAMRVDFVIIDALRFRVRRLVDEGLALPTVHECLARKDHRVFTQPLADHVAASLTADEIEAASRFYLSPIGRRFTRAAEINNHKLAGLTTEPLPSFSEGELSEVSRFNRSPVGQRLHSAIGKVLPSMAPIADELLQACGATGLK